MKYVVSACLMGVNCKYNGGNNASAQVMEFLKDKEYIMVCPEVLGGLPSPRPCCEKKDNRIITENGDDVTEAFERGASLALSKAQAFGCNIAILQPRSPSCGCGRIYSGHFDGKLIHGNGMFAQMLLMQGIQVISEEEIFHFMAE